MAVAPLAGKLKDMVMISERPAEVALPEGTVLSTHSKAHLDWVAAELNERPRDTLGDRTPAQALAELLSDPPKTAALQPPLPPRSDSPR